MEGRIDVSGTVEGRIYVSGIGKVGEIYVSGIGKVGWIYVSEDSNLFAPPVEVEADHRRVLGSVTVSEVEKLRQALLEGKINGTQYEGACACLKGTLEKGLNDKLKHDAEELAEKWYLAIPKGHTPENNYFSRKALEWTEKFLEEAADE